MAEDVTVLNLGTLESAASTQVTLLRNIEGLMEDLINLIETTFYDGGRSGENIVYTLGNNSITSTRLLGGIYGINQAQLNALGYDLNNTVIPPVPTIQLTQPQVTELSGLLRNWVTLSEYTEATANILKHFYEYDYSYTVKNIVDTNSYGVSSRFTSLLSSLDGVFWNTYSTREATIQTAVQLATNGIDPANDITTTNGFSLFGNEVKYINNDVIIWDPSARTLLGGSGGSELLSVLEDILRQLGTDFENSEVTFNPTLRQIVKESRDNIVELRNEFSVDFSGENPNTIRVIMEQLHREFSLETDGIPARHGGLTMRNLQEFLYEEFSSNFGGGSRRDLSMRQISENLHEEFSTQSNTPSLEPGITVRNLQEQLYREFSAGFGGDRRDLSMRQMTENLHEEFSVETLGPTPLESNISMRNIGEYLYQEFARSAVDQQGGSGERTMRVLGEEVHAELFQDFSENQQRNGTPFNDISVRFLLEELYKETVMGVTGDTNISMREMAEGVYHQMNFTGDLVDVLGNNNGNQRGLVVDDGSVDFRVVKDLDARPLGAGDSPPDINGNPTAILPLGAPSGYQGAGWGAPQSDDRSPETLKDYLSLVLQETRSIDEGGQGDQRYNKNGPWTYALLLEFNSSEDLDGNGKVFGVDFIINLSLDDYPVALRAIVDPIYDFWVENRPDDMLTVQEYLDGIPEDQQVLPKDTFRGRIERAQQYIGAGLGIDLDPEDTPEKDTERDENGLTQEEYAQAYGDTPGQYNYQVIQEALGRVRVTDAATGKTVAIRYRPDVQGSSIVLNPDGSIDSQATNNKSNPRRLT